MAQEGDKNLAMDATKLHALSSAFVSIFIAISKAERDVFDAQLAALPAQSRTSEQSGVH